jgi:hypothetical protein
MLKKKVKKKKLKSNFSKKTVKKNKLIKIIARK